MFIAYKYSVILKCILHDFPAFALFSHAIVKMSEGTFCRVEVHMHYKIRYKTHTPNNIK